MATIDDVARLAGVAPTTVSNALSGKAHVARGRGSASWPWRTNSATNQITPLATSRHAGRWQLA